MSRSKLSTMKSNDKYEYNNNPPIKKSFVGIKLLDDEEV